MSYSIELGKSEIQHLIKQRSLYILKKKFEIYKNQISQIYNQYRQSSIHLTVIGVNNINEVILNIMKITQFFPITSNNYNDLITGDLMTTSMRKNSEKIIDDLCEYAKKKVNEYNFIFYEKKMKEIQIKKEIDLARKDDETEKKLTLYDKRGNLIKTNEDIKKNNVELDINGIVYIVSENDIEVLNSNRYIYCEVIPLLIADYIEKNINISLVSLNDELNDDLGKLFDAEIIKKISILEKYDPIEEKNGKIKAFLYEEMNVEEQIKLFENILYEKNKNRENTSYIMDMIQKLKTKKVMLHNNISSLRNNLQDNSTSIITSSNFNNNNNNYNTTNKSKLITLYSKPTKEQLRKNALTEIFYFYSRQHNLIGSSNVTFTILHKNEENLNLSEFLKFCVEFKVLVKKEKLIEIFRKNTKDSKNMDLNGFLIAVQNLSISVNDEKINGIEKRIKLCKLRLKEINEEEKKSKEEIVKKTSEKAILERENEELEDEEKKENYNFNLEEKNEENNNNENIENNEEKKEENNNIISENKIEEENNEEQTKTLNSKNSIKEEDINNIEKSEVINSKEDVSKKDYRKGNKIITEITTTITTNKRKRSLNLYSREELIDTLNKYFQQLEILKNKTKETLLEEFYLYLEIDFVKLYRKKMIGFVLPFSIHDSIDFRITRRNNKDILLKKKKENYAKEKREILERLYEERELEKKLKEEKEKKNLSLKKQKNKLNNNETLPLKILSEKKTKSYIKILKNKQDYESGKVDKFTWNELGKYDYRDFVSSNKEEQNKISKSQRNILKVKKSKANINDYHVDELFNNNDFFGNVDDEDKELLGHLIGNDNKNHKNTFFNKSLKYSIDASGHNNNKSEIHGIYKNNTFQTEVINRKKYSSNINENNIITSQDIIKEFEERNEERQEQFEKNYNNNLMFQRNNNANIIKKYEKKRVPKKS